VAVVIPIITLIVGALLGSWYTVWMKRPKLRPSGSSGAGGQDFHSNSIRLRNQPGLLGLNLPETIIFGKQIHGYIERGLTFERTPAKDCRATIHDKKSGRHIAHLWWRRPPSSDGGPAWAMDTTIESGEECDLMLFARLTNEPLKYFIFAPQNPVDPSSPVQVPVEHAKFNDTHEFSVRVSYSYNRQKYTFTTIVTKGYDGRLSHQGPVGGGSF
jgi:hypothetical protein